MIPEISNSDNLPTIYLPLILIIVFGLIKDYYVEFQIYKSDQEENLQKVQMLEKEKFIETQWGNLRVGNIVKVQIFLLLFLID